MRTLSNIYILSIKEIKAFFADKVIFFVVVFIFSFSLIAVSNAANKELKNVSVAVVDNDDSLLSRSLINSLNPPYFKLATRYANSELAQKAMDDGKVIFIIEFPKHLERDLLHNLAVDIQITADATVSSQAGIGINYITQIINMKLQEFLQLKTSFNHMNHSVNVISNVEFNQNLDEKTYISVMNLSNFMFMLIMLVVGAAVIREREKGTMAHLLVMPVSATEIALSKIIANGIIISCAAMTSLFFIIQGVLGIKVTASISLYLLCIVIFMFSAASFGILLATISVNMPQFSILMIPVMIVLRFISGAETSFDSMPYLMQKLTVFSPLTHFVSLTGSVLFRNADLKIILPELMLMALMGMIFLFFALSRFRLLLERQN